VKLQARGLDLSNAPGNLEPLLLTVEVGAVAFQGTATCTAHNAGRLTRCGP